MRTNIDIDDDLMAAAMQASGLSTKRETVEAGLRVLVQRHKAYADILALAGQIDWQGDLDAWRRDKPRKAQDLALRAAEPPAQAYKKASAGGRAKTGKKAAAS
jgi:Arc/MetJ family transcription regulator